MRLLYTFMLAFVITFAVQAQEIKVNPVGMLFGNFDIAYEQFVAEDWGIEGLMGFSTNGSSVDNDYSQNGISLGATGKHYFNPRRVCDRFHIGAYTRFFSGEISNIDDSNDNSSNTRLSFGFFAGQKWMSKKGISIEVNFGVGRPLYNKFGDDEFASRINSTDIDIFGRLALGYRWKSEESRN
ncbi:MAG: DUF3575 domain-containing protein [Saprospiraceae bacterium]|nr:DUF3575 domain-containing protein [Saprospiraceae bacterium]